MKLCPRCGGEGCWSDYPGNWYVCEPCGEIGALNDDGSALKPHRWLSEDEIIALKAFADSGVLPAGGG
jgi:hypothetical protein